MFSISKATHLVEGDGDAGILPAALTAGQSVCQRSDRQLPAVPRGESRPWHGRGSITVVATAVQRVPVGEVAQGNQLDHRYATSANSPAFSRDPLGRLCVI